MIPGVTGGIMRPRAAKTLRMNCTRQGLIEITVAILSKCKGVFMTAGWLALAGNRAGSVGADYSVRLAIG